MADLIIKIGASAKEYKDEMDAISRKTEDFAELASQAGKIAAAAFATVTAAIGFSVKEYLEAEKVSVRTNAILKATGQIAGVTASDVSNLASALQKTTKFSDEMIQEGENILLTFTKIGKETFPVATEAALDLASKMGGDAASAAQLLGKALQNPAQGLAQLKRAGIDFTDAQIKQIEYFDKTNNIAGAQDIILKQLQNTIGGLARGEAASLGGSLVQLKNNFSDIAEEIGKQFAPFLKTAADKMKDLLEAVKGSDGTLTNFAVALGAIAAASGAIVVVSGLSLAVNGLAVALAPMALIMGGWVPVLGAIAGAALMAATGFAIFKSAVEEKHDARVKEFLAEKQMTFEEFQMKRSAEEKEKEAKQRHQNAIASEEAARKERALIAEDQALQYRLLLQDGYDQEIITKIQAFNQVEAELLLEKDAARREMLLAIREQDKLDMDLAFEEDGEKRAAVEAATLASTTLSQQTLIAGNANLRKTIMAQNKDSILTEKTAKDKFIVDTVKQQTDSNNTYLMESQKFGKAHAAVNQFFRDNEVGKSMQNFATMQNMQTSQNSILKGIGKAAAVSNIIMNTAQTATFMLGAFPIPFVGQALGIAAAAATIAFGAEQVGTVLGLSEGGLIRGGRMGVDSVPAMLMPNELVVPAQNFDEVITAVAASRSGIEIGNGQSSNVVVQIEFAGDASQLLTARQIEDRSLGISRES